MPAQAILKMVTREGAKALLCDGKWIMKNKKIRTVDEDAIIEEAKERAKAIVKRAGINIPDRFPTIKR